MPFLPTKKQKQTKNSPPPPKKKKKEEKGHPAETPNQTKQKQAKTEKKYVVTQRIHPFQLQFFRWQFSWFSNVVVCDSGRSVHVDCSPFEVNLQ